MNVAPSNLERLCKKHHQRQHNLEAHAAFRQLALSGRLTREESDLIQHSRGKSWMDNLITLAVKYQIPLISLYNKAHARMLKEFKANPTGGSCTFCEDWGDWFFKDGDSKNRSADNKIALCQVHKKAMREMMRKLVLHYADTHERPIQGQSLQQVIASLSLSYFKVFSKACVILKAKFGHAQ